MNELENHRVALATAKSQYEQAKDGLQRAKESEVSSTALQRSPHRMDFVLPWGYGQNKRWKSDC